MRRLAVFSAVCVFPMMALGVDTTPTNLPATITLVTPARVSLSDAQIPVTILLKNISDAPLKVAETPGGRAALADFQLTVVWIRPDGTMVKVRQVAAAPAPVRLPDGGRTLAPGESLKEVLNLKTTYAMTQPGDYTVEASRKLPLHEGMVTVRSDDVAIRVSPAGSGR